MIHLESLTVIKILLKRYGINWRKSCWALKFKSVTVTTIMDRYENFRMKEGESLDEAYDRFVILNNEMKKNKIPRTDFDQNVKFINNLLPEWKPFARFIKQHKQLDDLKLYEVFENLRLYEEDVAELVGLLKKKDNPVTDPIELVADKGKTLRYSSSSRRSDVSEGESEDDTEKEIMMENLLTVANNFTKKFYNRPGSNNRRLSSKPRAYDDREKYIPRQTDRYDRYRSCIYDNRYDTRDDR